MSGYGFVPTENLQAMRDHAHAEFREWDRTMNRSEIALDTATRMRKKWLVEVIEIDAEQTKRERATE